MVYDKKTYDEYIKKAIEPTDIQIYRSTPFSLQTLNLDMFIQNCGWILRQKNKASQN